MYDDLKRQLKEYNWDDGFELPQKIIDNPNCDLALALEVFYLADGYSYLENPSDYNGLEKWSAFIFTLYNDILNANNEVFTPKKCNDKMNGKERRVRQFGAKYITGGNPVW